MLKTNTKRCIIPALFLLFFGTFAIGQSGISGMVQDSNGEALIGASVYINGSDQGTTTDIDGNYSLNLTPGDYTVNYSFIGYSTNKVMVTVGDGMETINTVLSDDNLAFDEIVVTGTFSGRTQKDAPMSLTVLNAKQLQRLSSNSQADILRTVPGITAEGGGGEVATNLFVRGFPSGGQYAFTPLQIDGVPILSTFGLNSSAHDVYFRNDLGIRSLEFVRGGSSTLFGAGSVAGIVNYNSVTGTSTPDNKVQLEWAEGGRAKVDFLTSGPASENLFYAFSGFYRYDEGPLETGMPTRGYQLRGNVKKLFNDGNSSLTISAQAIDDNVQFYLPYPLSNEDGNRERPIGNDGEEIFTMLSGQLTDFSFDTPNGRFESPIGDGVSTTGGYLMADLKHSFGNNWKLSAKTKAARYDHYFNLFLDGDGVHNTPEDQANYLVDRSLPDNASFTYTDTGVELDSDDLLFENRILDRERPMEELVGEINLTKSVNNHNITVGTFLSHTAAEDNNWIHNVLGDFSNSPRAVGVSYVDANGETVNYSTGGFVSGRQTSNNSIESSKVAFYLADEIKGDRWNFDLGLRWERAAGIITKENGVGSNNFNRGTVSANDMAVALAALYKLDDNTNLYANFSRGYFFPQLRSVAFPRPGVTQSYETEKVIQGEIGAKYKANKLSGTAAIFFNALSDRRNVDFVNDPNDPANVIEEVQLQSTQTYGIELSLNYALNSYLNLYGNTTYQQHEFTSVESNPDQEGNSIARTPNFMGLIGANVDYDAFDFSLSSNFLGSKFANNSNTVELDGFNIVRLDLGYTVSLGQKDESVRLGLSVFNLLDQAGITEGSPRQGNAQGTSGDFFVGRPILPRRIFVKALFDF